tara:strand:- start:16112 stop:18982 length:2871 start_codon:yes stop_codon:yes gene_type:complete
MKSIWRNGVASSALILALSTGAAYAGDKTVVQPTDRMIMSFRGDIDPFRGDIDPFAGDINPFRGDIDPFYGDISPFWGDISPFWGDIDPFAGDIDPFSGDINPFWGDIDPFHGDINPFYGDIAPFWGEVGPLWGDINAFWGDIDPFTDDAVTLTTQLEGLFGQAEAVFGATVEAETGLSFRNEFLQTLLSDHGIDLSNPDTLDQVTAAQRSAFFLAFYDGLMNFSGTDRVDHWMPAINWSPALSQAAGSGNGVIVGLLDFSLLGDDGLNVRNSHGETDYLHFNHGAAVASLIGAPHDGQGVMGVAPGVTFLTYNPFDASLSTNWQDVRDGVLSLTQSGSSIVNMSLGMPGWTLHQQWASVFSDRTITAATRDTLFVVAAGNDGSSQTVDVNWTGVGTLDNLLIVGSVNPVGGISTFSNRPGTACLTINGACEVGNRLMDRFLVAPGELILVSDGEGGVTRLSGTSFAAPLVSGAAALVKGRWSWLEASDVADVLLQSAQDLGAPGVDEVYGWGLLDVNAAMSPLNVQDMVFLRGDNIRQAVRSIGLIPGKLTFHSDDENVITLFEPINGTYRDFVVALADVVLENPELYQAGDAETEAYIAERTAFRFDGQHFSDTSESASVLHMNGNWQLSAVAAAADPRAQTAGRALPFQAGMRLVDTATTREMRFGLGEGALALNSQDGFGLFSDHRPETGGVNPVLGFASGGAYAMTATPLGDATRLTVGISSAQDEHLFLNPFSGEEQNLVDGISAYQAVAFLTDLSHDVGDTLTVHASYTLLHEATGLLGAQGSGGLSLEGGAMTDALTMGAEARLPFGLTLSSSATLARTRAASFGDSLLSMPDATVSSAFQLTARRDQVFGSRDALRFSIIQPLHVESGAIEYSSLQITDRETGDLGADVQTWELGGQRPLFAEVIYATPLLDGRADLSLFTRAELAGESSAQDVAGMATGARFRLEF